MKKSCSICMALLFAIMLLTFATKDATANPFKPLSPIDDPEVFSQTGRVESYEGGVSAKSSEAALAGLEMLKKGGNAVDAIVASGLASCVTSGGMRTIAGYGGAMVVFLKKIGKPIVVDFNSYAPYNLKASMFPNQGATNDALNVLTVLPWSPVAGLYTALKNYGTMSWEEVLQPAIRLAEEGYYLSAANANAINNNCKPGKKFAVSPASVPIYCPTGGYKAGDLFIQKDLAGSLRILAKKGPNAIYTGELGKKMVGYLQSIGGVITMGDLEGWQDRLVRIEQPAHTNYRGYDVYTSAICTGGENLINILNILEQFNLDKQLTTRTAHLMMEAMKIGFTDRLYYVTDPWSNNVPYSGLMSKEYAKKRAQEISETLVGTYSPGNPWPYDNNYGPDFYMGTKYPFVVAPDIRPNTSSTSAVDMEGNIVAMTFTVNSGYGSGITVPGTGITLNDGLTGNKFTLNPQDLNYLEGGKLLVNNMNAYLILKDGKPIISNGAAGGRTIITSCVNTIVNMVDFGKDIYDAMNAPRFHCENAESTCYFESIFGTDTTTYEPILDGLIKMGHNGKVQGNIGAQHGLQVDPQTGKATIALDLRDDRSTAAGFQKE